ncbi:MAG: autotransporter-associated beta strand repeat-containing protein [Pseudomonadota bacterium]
MSFAAYADTIVDNGEVVTYPPPPGQSFSDALVVGQSGAGTVNINAGATVQMNTADGSTASRIELGNGAGSNGTLNINGGTLTVNIASGSTPPPTSIGRIWVGGGVNNTTGGTGVLNLSAGRIEFVSPTTTNTNYGALAIGRGAGVQGTLNQTGGTIQFQSGGAIDLGTQGGSGSYSLSNNAVFDAGNGGLTMYIGSRGGSGGQLSTGTLTIRDSAQFTMTTGPNSGGQLFVGDAGSTGTIHQSGAASVVTLGLMNPIRFGGNISNSGLGGGTGTYRLDDGTLNVRNVGGSAQIIFGDVAGGTGTFEINGGSANIATNLVVANAAGSTGSVVQTGGTLSLTDGARLSFGSGTGSYSLLGGTFAVGGTNGISGTGALAFGNATLRVQGSALTTSSSATIQNGTQFTFDTNGLAATWNGSLSGSGNMAKAGAGTLTLGGNNSSYSGSVALQAGTLALTNTNGLNANNAVTTSAGTKLDLTGLATGAAVNIGALSGTGTVQLGDSYLVSNIASGQSAAFSGRIVSDTYGFQSNYGRFTKAGDGDLLINGSTMEKGEGYIVGGSMTQSAGTTAWSNLNVGSGAGANGALNVSGGTLTLNVGMRVGDFGGTGTVHQTGGTVQLLQTCDVVASCASLNIGNQGGTGTYNISGGQLLLNGGSHSIGRNAGGNAAGNGTLNISGTGLVEVSPSEHSRGFLVIGDRDPSNVGITNSNGVINQTGGTLRIVDTSELYLGGYGSGTYNLSGGTLEVGGTSLRGNYGPSTGPYAFNLGGGTVKVIGSALTASVNATLVNGTNSTINTNGLGATWSGVLSGAGGLIKDGGGTLTLTGANSYTGGTRVDAGTLLVSGGGTLGATSGSTTVNGGTLDLGGTTQTQNGGVSLTSGTIQNGTLSSGGDFALGAGVVSANLTGTGGVVKSGTGTVALSGNNTYSGGTAIEGGLINFVSAANFGSGSITLNGGGLQWATGSTADISNSVSLGAAGGTFDTNGNNVGLASSIAGAGSLTKAGAGTLTLSAANSYSGGTHVNAGTLMISGGGTLGVTSGSTTVNGGTLDLGGTTQTQDGGVSLTGGTIQNGTLSTAGDFSLSGGTVNANLTGGGRVVKTGTGTVVLSGSNTHTGGTVAQGGLINFASTANFGTGSITLSGGGLQWATGNTTDISGRLTALGSGGGTFHTNGNNVTLASAITGAGGLTKAGAGTLTLSAANSYTGGTVVSGGTLLLSGLGTLGASSGSTTVTGGVLDLGGTTQTQNGGVIVTGGTIQNGTFSSSATFEVESGTVNIGLSGSGGLVKNGAGTVVLSAANNYTGGTIINEGAVSVSNDSNLGAAGSGIMLGGGALLTTSSFTTTRPVTLNAGGGALETAPGTTLTLAGSVSGAGGLTKTGNGALVLQEASSFTGSTTIGGGVLALSGNGSLAQSSGVNLAAAGATLDISASTGNQTIQDLAGATGSAIALGGNTLATGTSNSTTFGGSIDGTGGLVKQGSGTLVLTGTSTYTGPTAVNAGGLVVNGSVASTVTLDSGTVLGGSGTIGGLVANTAVLAPGNSIGTLTVNGNAVQNGGTYVVEVNAQGQSDRVNVTGTATINGTAVQVVAASGNYATSTTYTILSAAGGVSGTYSSVTSNFAFLTPSLTYDAENVFLTLALQGAAFSGFGGNTPNQRSVGYALDQAYANATGDFATVIGALANLNTTQAGPALGQISGQPVANFGTANLAANMLFMNAVGQQMALARGNASANGQRVALAEACEIEACDGASPLSAWMSAVGGLGSVQGNGNASTFTYNLGGAAAGIDYRVAPNLLAGIGVGYTSGTQWTDSFMGKGWSNAVSVTAYGSFTWGGFYADALAGYAYASNQVQRQITVPGLQPRTASGSTGANQFLGQAEIGYGLSVFPAAQATVTPFARVQVSTVNQAGFSEWGANSLSLNVAQQTTNSVRTTFGAELAGAVSLGIERKLALALRLGWLHEYADTARPMTASFAGAPSNAFTIYGATPTRDSAAIGFQASTAVAENASLYLRYDGELAAGTDNHTLNVGFRLSW